MTDRRLERAEYGGSVGLVMGAETKAGSMGSDAVVEQAEGAY